VAEVRGLYAWLGEPVSEEFATGMARWFAGNSQDREPGARRDPSEYGVDLAHVRSLFASYSAWAGV
jgi:hypothetical protein